MGKCEFIGIPIVISEFLKDTGILDLRYTELLLSDILYKRNKRTSNVFSINLNDIKSKLNCSIKKIRSSIQNLISLNILIQKKSLYEKTQYKFNLKNLFQKFELKSIEEIQKSKKIYIPQKFFSKLTKKNGLSDLKLIFIYNKILDLSKGVIGCDFIFEYSHIGVIINCSISTSKRLVKKLISMNLIVKDFNQANCFRLVKNELFDLKFSNVDNSVDNLVDNSVDNSAGDLLSFAKISSKWENNISNIIRINIDKEIYDFVSQKKAEKKVRVPSKKTPPPLTKQDELTYQKKNNSKIDTRSYVITQKNLLTIQSIINNKETLKNPFKTKKHTKTYKNAHNYQKIYFKHQLKTLEQILFEDLNIIEYENFIYRLEKRNNHMFSENFIKKLVKKLSQKYSHYKFRSLRSVENYFYKALMYEKMDKIIANSQNFTYRKDIDYRAITAEKKKIERMKSDCKVEFSLQDFCKNICINISYT